MPRKFKNVILPDNLDLRDIGNGEFMLLADYRVFWTEGAKEHSYTVPAKFVTDLASIPRVFQSLIPKLGRHNGPSVIHDRQYVEKTWKKRDVDRFFRATSKAAKVPYHRRILMWLAVRSPIGRIVWET